MVVIFILVFLFHVIFGEIIITHQFHGPAGLHKTDEICVCAVHCFGTDCNGFVLSDDNQCDYIDMYDSPLQYIGGTFIDCKSWFTHMYSKEGVYTFSLSVDGSSTFLAPCDIQDGVWTVIQRRVDISVNFYRGWNDYKAGFGDLDGNFWLGLDLIHKLTNGGTTQLQITMETFEDEFFVANYHSFQVGDAASGYQMHCSGFTGNAGDSLSGHNSMKFSTFDNDQDDNNLNCAETYKGAWWYRACHDSNLNGQYLIGSASYADGINWLTAKGHYYSMKTVVMKIRNA